MPRYRFGTFDFDPDQGELWRDGVPVRFQRQPGQVLAILLTNAGEVVSRETLRNAVWGTDTHVDFDNGLNFCVAQIRSALRDSAESPRYIRTVPRRGYQFVAPVTAVGAFNQIAETAATGRRTAGVFTRARVVLVLSLAATGGAAFWLLKQMRSPSGSFHRSPAVAVFRLDNNTGNPQYDRLAEVLTDSLVADLTDAGLKDGSAAYTVIGNDVRLLRPRSQRDLAAIGAELGTPFTISGSIRAVAATGSAGKGGFEVFAQLITLPDQRHRKVVRVELPAGALSPVPPEVPRRIVETFDPVIRAIQVPL